jgi:hypothetical protein
MKILKFIFACLALPFFSIGQTVDVTFTPITVDANTISLEVYVSCSAPRYLAAMPCGWNYGAPNNLTGNTPSWVNGPGVNFGPSSYNVTTVRFGYTMNPAIPAGDRLLINTTPQLLGTLTIVDNIAPLITFPFSTTVRYSGAVSLSATTYATNTDNTGIITHTAASSNITVAGVVSNATPIVYSAPLPVELSELTAKEKGASNLVQWTTESELNSQYHIVERSGDGIENWTEVGRKLAAGTTQVKQHYYLDDERPLPMSYYRLKLVDFDGKFEYSKVVSVERRASGFGVANMFPMPTSDKVTLQVNLPEFTNLTVSLTDVNGRLLQFSDMELEKGTSDVQVDLSRFAAGTYFVKLDNGVEQLTEQVVKQ